MDISSIKDDEDGDVGSVGCCGCGLLSKCCT
jgi:hypothetical protein